MNKETTTNRTDERAGEPNHINWRWRMRAFGIMATLSLGVLIYSAMATVPQPVLKISDLGGNQFSVGITNGVSTTNYTLFWTPVLESPLYPWEVWGVGNVGQTNFTVAGGIHTIRFFRVLIGSDADGDGTPEWQDAQPINPNVGVLSVTIDSPLTGTIFQ